MATVIEDRPREEKGLGLAGVIAIIVLVLLAAFFLFRSVGADPEVDTGADVNVSGSLEGTSGSF